ncbi:MAG: RNA methyltransferase [Pseudomonadales bacterium]|nr:RNA methyltransferase [Pseudomonadales bacterium]
MTDSSKLPSIRFVLVEPSHPGNIGAAARAMKTMGLNRLYMVAPKRYPDPQAEWRAANALDVLDNAIVVRELSEAIADCDLVIGTSTRSRTIPWPLHTAREIGDLVVADSQSSEIAILFGREASGLSNDELQRCHMHLQIPTHPEYPSLNLSMAVQIVAYELYQAKIRAVDDNSKDGDGSVAASSASKEGKQEHQSPLDWDRPLSTGAAMESFFEHLELVLGQTGFLDPGNPGKVLIRFRRLFMRIRPDETEMQMLRGFLSQIQIKLKMKPQKQSAPVNKSPH